MKVNSFLLLFDGERGGLKRLLGQGGDEGEKAESFIHTALINIIITKK